MINIPKIIGHRGAKGYAPENTFASFRKAKELGATWVEFDVQETMDGVLIVIHDDTLDRTTNGTGIVAHTPWKVIEKLDAGSWFDPKFHSEKISTFAETISLLAELNLAANVEIKPYKNEDTKVAVAVAKLIKKMWPSNIPPALVSSFSFPSLLAVKETAPDLTIGILFEALPKNWKEMAKQVNAKTVHMDQNYVDASITKMMREEKYPLLAYTVNDKTRAEELWAMGLTSIFTDFPY